jgi:threonine dehydrogenase-like Zn-dependent dehydrogenase
VNPNRDVCTRNVCVLGIGGETAEGYAPAMDEMAAWLDKLPLATVVTHRLPLERAAEAIRISESPEAMKVVFAPGAGSG